MDLVQPSIQGVETRRGAGIYKVPVLALEYILESNSPHVVKFSGNCRLVTQRWLQWKQCIGHPKVVLVCRRCSLVHAWVRFRWLTWVPWTRNWILTCWISPGDRWMPFSVAHIVRVGFARECRSFETKIIWNWENTVPSLANGDFQSKHPSWALSFAVMSPTDVSQLLKCQNLLEVACELIEKHGWRLDASCFGLEVLLRLSASWFTGVVASLIKDRVALHLYTRTSAVASAYLNLELDFRYYCWRILHWETKEDVSTASHDKPGRALPMSFDLCSIPSRGQS